MAFQPSVGSRDTRVSRHIRLELQLRCKRTRRPLTKLSAPKRSPDVKVRQ